MPTPKQGPRLGGSASHQKKILASPVRQLIEHGKVKTTNIKAKLLRPYVEKLIIKAKRGIPVDRRNAAELFNDNYAVKKLFDGIGPQFADHDGGHTRIIELGNCKDDNAPIPLIALVEEETVTVEAIRVIRAATSKQAEKAKAEEAEAKVAEEE